MTYRSVKSIKQAKNKECRTRFELSTFSACLNFEEKSAKRPGVGHALPLVAVRRGLAQECKRERLHKMQRGASVSLRTVRTSVDASIKNLFQTWRLSASFFSVFDLLFYRFLAVFFVLSTVRDRPKSPPFRTHFSTYRPEPENRKLTV